ncbi:MAG: MATE family efflux transporter [Chloroflexi bacterium]|nr:MATE family efflux transporter [Chloroflexota bacterium]
MLDYARLYLKAWDWRLFLFILLFLGLPNVYQIYRVYLIGNVIPDPGSLAIVSQWQFVGLVVEVFQEGTVLAIFFFLGSQLRSSAAIQLDRTKSVFTFIFVASLLFSLGIFLFRDAFITVIGTSGEIQDQTREFLGISIFSVPFSLLSAAMVVLFEALRKRALMFAMAVSNVLLLFVFDSLFFGGHAFSLDLGVIGTAWSTLLSSALLFTFGTIFLFANMRIPASSLLVRPSFGDMGVYLRVGLGSGLDSLVRNVAYFFMIIRLVNTIGATEIGGYYLAIQILWSFMLVPVLAFADSAKALVANASGDLPRMRTLWHASMFIVALFMVVWIAAVPGFEGFAGILSSDAATVAYAVTAFGILFVPYVLFSFNTVMDAFFYGTGRTEYLAYQSIITNGTVYVVAFLLYVSGVWTPTFEGVMVLFSLGILVDSILTMAFLLKILYLSPAKIGRGTPALA